MTANNTRPPCTVRGGPFGGKTIEGMTMSTKYAVVPTRGMYGSGEKIHVWKHYGNVAAAQAAAGRLTRLHRQGMARHGGSGGGYRVIECTISTRAISGYDLDRTPDAR